MRRFPSVGYKRAVHKMTYRSPPPHCLSKPRKQLSWWRRIVLGRKARIWYDAMTETDPMKLLMKQMGRTVRETKRDLRMFGRMAEEILTAIESSIKENDNP